MTWVLFALLLFKGKRIDDIERSVTDLMNDLGLSDEEGEKQKQ
jgi:heat shock factor-binding protein 1